MFQFCILDIEFRPKFKWNNIRRRIFFTSDEKKQTELRLSHNSQMLIPVNGYQEPGSYVRKIRYDTGIEELNELVDRSYSCKQYIEYRCNNSKLLATPRK